MALQLLFFLLLLFLLFLQQKQSLAGLGEQEKEAEAPEQKTSTERRRWQELEDQLAGVHIRLVHDDITLTNKKITFFSGP